MMHLWKSLVVFCLFVAGTAFLFIARAERSDNLVGLNVHSNPTETMRMTNLPITGAARTKGLRVGLWGGEHIKMEVTGRGATIEYDCAHGSIGQKIALDRRGRFSVSGKQFAEHGGPVRQEEEQLAGDPVQFTGQINGETMKLSVRNRATKELVGDFTLAYGVEPRLRKCR